MADSYDLERFVRAQARDYERALAEIRAGRKRSHWMWYVFPQIEGLGGSAMSRRYAIRSRAEAEAYLRHRVLGARLSACMQATLEVDGRSAYDIFGTPDDMKLHSSATLFANVSRPGSVFHAVIDRYFDGEPDGLTLSHLDRLSAGSP